MTTPDQLVPMIIPTVMIPLTMVSVGVSVVATFIAGLFGIQLKLEGPRKLLELLLKPRILFTAFMANLLILGGIYSFKWVKNYPKFIKTIESEMVTRGKQSALDYENNMTNNVSFIAIQKRSVENIKIEQVWKTSLESGSFRAPVASGKRIFIGTTKGTIEELDIEKGERIRSFYVGTFISPRISIWKNSLYVGEGSHDTHHARLYQFSLKTGMYHNSFQSLGHHEGQAVIGTYRGQTLALVVAGKDGLHAVNPETMEKVWSYNIGHIDAAVTIERGVVYIGTGREKGNSKKYKTYAAALSFESGKELWKKETPLSTWTRPILIKNDVCFLTGEIYFPSKRGDIVCFDKDSGKHSFGLHGDTPLISSAFTLGESIFFSSVEGRLCRFNTEARKVSWCFESKQKRIAYGGATYDPNLNVVIYPTIKDGLYILNPENGKVVSHWVPNKKNGEWFMHYADITVHKGLWIISDLKGTVRALRAQVN